MAGLEGVDGGCQGEAPECMEGAPGQARNGVGRTAKAGGDLNGSNQARVMKFIDKQMMWDAAKQRKQHDVAVKVNSRENEQCTFAPTLFSRKRDKNGSMGGDGDGLTGGEGQPRHLGRESPFNHHIARLERARRAREEQKAAIQIRVEGFYRPRGKPRSHPSGDVSPDRRELKQQAAALADREDQPATLDAQAQPNPQHPSQRNRRQDQRQSEHVQIHHEPVSHRQSVESKNPPTPQIHKWLLETSRYDDEDLSEDPEETFFEQLQRERRQWARERSRMLRVIELQQQELKKRGEGVEDRAIDIANTFSAAVTTFEQRIITMEGQVESELAGLRKELRQSMEAAQESKPNGGVSNSRLNRLEEQLAAIASHVKVLAQAPAGQTTSQGKRQGSGR